MPSRPGSVHIDVYTPVVMSIGAISTSFYRVCRVMCVRRCARRCTLLSGVTTSACACARGMHGVVATVTLWPPVDNRWRTDNTRLSPISTTRLLCIISGSCLRTRLEVWMVVETGGLSVMMVEVMVTVIGREHLLPGVVERWRWGHESRPLADVTLTVAQWTFGAIGQESGQTVEGLVLRHPGQTWVWVLELEVPGWICDSSSVLLFLWNE